MNYDALLVVDVQTALLDDNPYNKDDFIEKVQQLINSFRENNIPVIYVRHDGGAGDELEYGCQGWPIARSVTPSDSETIVDKRYNSSFRETGLKAELDSMGAKRIVICGMQTEHCIDATCKVAFEYGYDIVMAKGGTTTFDNEVFSGKALVNYYENKIWNNRYAKVISVQEIINTL